jgi:hypothetical protein
MQKKGGKKKEIQKYRGKTHTQRYTSQNISLLEREKVKENDKPEAIPEAETKSSQINHSYAPEGH